MINALYDPVGAALHEEHDGIVVCEDLLLGYEAVDDDVRRDVDVGRDGAEAHHDALREAPEGTEEGLYLENVGCRSMFA